VFEALLLPSTDRNILEFFLKFSHKSQIRILSLFFGYECSPPPLLQKNSFTLLSLKKHRVGAKNERFIISTLGKRAEGE